MTVSESRSGCVCPNESVARIARRRPGYPGRGRAGAAGAPGSAGPRPVPGLCPRAGAGAASTRRPILSENRPRCGRDSKVTVIRPGSPGCCNQHCRIASEPAPGAGAGSPPLRPTGHESLPSLGSLHGPVAGPGVTVTVTVNAWRVAPARFRQRSHESRLLAAGSRFPSLTRNGLNSQRIIWKEVPTWFLLLSLFHSSVALHSCFLFFVSF